MPRTRVPSHRFCAHQAYACLCFPSSSEALVSALLFVPNMCGYILTVDQSDVSRMGIFSPQTNQLASA
eukprot:1055551-Pyramimonas_sp.AAC.1